MLTNEPMGGPKLLEKVFKEFSKILKSILLQFSLNSHPKLKCIPSKNSTPFFPKAPSMLFCSKILFFCINFQKSFFYLQFCSNFSSLAPGWMSGHETGRILSGANEILSVFEQSVSCPDLVGQKTDRTLSVFWLIWLAWSYVLSVIFWHNDGFYMYH